MSDSICEVIGMCDEADQCDTARYTAGERRALPGLVPLFGVIGYILASNLARRDPARFKDMGNTKA